MKFVKMALLISVLLASTSASAGAYFVSGKITSLLASATDPAIRITGNASPDDCNGGNYGWLYFQGTAEEQQRVYATALALSLSGHTATVYTNNDGESCRITSIQVTSGLN